MRVAAGWSLAGQLVGLSVGSVLYLDADVCLRVRFLWFRPRLYPVRPLVLCVLVLYLSAIPLTVTVPVRNTPSSAYVHD